MTLLKIGDEYADRDFELLRRHLKLLDAELSQINVSIVSSRDPESDGLLDAGEYFIGHGFIAIQRYITATRTALGVGLSQALKFPPMLQGDISLVAALYAGANYWKHVDEWFQVLNMADNSDLHGSAISTLKQVETVTPWEEYTCANMLAALLDGQALELSRLLPAIEQWRHNIFLGHLTQTEG
jgi:hypothetical protein